MQVNDEKSALKRQRKMTLPIVGRALARQKVILL